MKPMIYMDNAATTKPFADVVEAMIPYYKDSFYNPSANYDMAYDVNDVLQDCRKTIANTIGCEANEIYFTSGGTESDNWALRYAQPGQHIITSKIEHHAVLNTCKYLESIGVDVSYINVDEHGMIILEELEKSIKTNTSLISIMTANNEIGTIQPILDIAKIAFDYGIAFHTDAVQAYGHKELDVNELGIDMLSASAHKFNGPKGVGFLYVNKCIKLQPFILGGMQQGGMRAGTENVPGIVGMAKAADLSCDLDNIYHRAIVAGLRDYMLSKIKAEIPNIIVNGDLHNRLQNNLNISFIGIRGEQLLSQLAMNGIYASTGSACNAFSPEPSHVLKAIGLSDEDASSSIRFTLSKENTIDEINYTVDVLKRSVEDLRRIG